MRAQRRRLTASQQIVAARALARQLIRTAKIRYRDRWSIYLSHEGEIDPGILYQRLARYKRIVFLPVLHPVHHNRLLFVKFDKAATLVRNKYGIYEPSLKNAKPVPAWTLNVICLPLVAFDQYGHRLGMGGGYYDRTLAKPRLIIRSPWLIGTAHQFQRVKKLPADYWDIPLNAIVTDAETLWCRALR